MATIHISQADAENGLGAMLEQLDADTSFVIESEKGPVALLLPAPPKQLTFAERLALLPKRTDAVMTEDFARDIQEAIDRYRTPLDTTIFDD